MRSPNARRAATIPPLAANVSTSCKSVSSAATERPVPGNGKYEWNGFLPFEDLPSSYNPASGFVTTSNQNILPPGYSKPLNYDWAEPFRHDRLVDVLRDSSRFTRQDFERLQHDELSLPARTLVPLLRAAGHRIRPVPEGGARAACGRHGRG